MNIATLIDITGWVGVVSLLVGYALVSARKLEGDAASYQLMNVFGSGLLIVNSLYYRAYPSVGVNIAWVGIALMTLIHKRFASKVTRAA